jgi:hypothetical protein
MYIYFYSSIVLLIFWLFFFFKLKNYRSEMLIVSTVSLFGAFLEPFFLVGYWTPNSLFDLNLKFGFDIESFLFSFACGGIVVGLYNFFWGKGYKIIKQKEKKFKYYINRFGIILPVILIFLLYFFFDLYFIYAVFVSFIVQFFFVSIVRKDLFKIMIYGGFAFFLFYLIFFKFLIILFPVFLESWNLDELSGILFLGLPIEELVWAFLFGTFGAVFYRYVFFYSEEESNKKKLF